MAAYSWSALTDNTLKEHNGGIFLQPREKVMRLENPHCHSDVTEIPKLKLALPVEMVYHCLVLHSSSCLSEDRGHFHVAQTSPLCVHCSCAHQQQPVSFMPSCVAVELVFSF